MTGCNFYSRCLFLTSGISTINRKHRNAIIGGCHSQPSTKIPNRRVIHLYNAITISNCPPLFSHHCTVVSFTQEESVNLGV